MLTQFILFFTFFFWGKPFI